MSELLFLTSDDFYLTEGSNGIIMCNSIPGFALVLFYSTQCIHCQKLLPIFKSLPGTIGGCQFAMINISKNKNCIAMANKSITPLAYVPYMLLYINGRPFMKYNGPSDIKEIQRFVIEISKNVQNKQQFTNANIKEDPRGGIPAYTIGHPLYGDGDEVNYLEFNEAYDLKFVKKPPHNGVGNIAMNSRQQMVENAMNKRFK